MSTLSPPSISVRISASATNFRATARSQGIGGMVFGIGMALLEHTAIHPRRGTFVSPDLAGYLTRFLAGKQPIAQANPEVSAK